MKKIDALFNRIRSGAPQVEIETATDGLVAPGKFNWLSLTRVFARSFISTTLTDIDQKWGDKNGQIDSTEFGWALANVATEYAPEWREIAAPGQEWVDRAHLASLIEREADLGSFAVASQELAELAMWFFDSNADGRITREEYESFLTECKALDSEKTRKDSSWTPS